MSERPNAPAASKDIVGPNEPEEKKDGKVDAPSVPSATVESFFSVDFRLFFVTFAAFATRFWNLDVPSSVV